MNPSEFGTTDLTDILKKPIEPVTFIVDDFLKRHGITLISSPSKVGKTFLAQHLSLCIANGESFFGHRTEKCTVLYLNMECYNDLFLTRFKLMSEGEDMNTKGIKIETFPQLKLEGEKAKIWQNILRTCLDRYEHTVVIVDTCIRILDKGNENLSNDVRKVFETIHHLLNNSSWIMINHTGWDGKRSRGSSEWKAFPDNLFTLESVKNKKCRFKIKADELQRVDIDFPQIIVNINGSVKDEVPINLKVIDRSSRVECRSKTEEYAYAILNWMEVGIEYKKQEISRKFRDIPYDSLTDTLRWLINNNKCIKPCIGIYKKISKITPYK